MKIIERRIVARNKYGRIVFNNHNLEEHEKDTIFYLAKFGFDIETIKPSNIPKSNNSDLMMLGATWEMKELRIFNMATIQTKFRKAAKQSGGRAIFDLRNTQNHEYEIQEYVIRLFQSTRSMKRIMIIKSDGRLLDISK